MAFEVFIVKGLTHPRISAALLKSNLILNLDDVISGAQAKTEIETFLTRKNRSRRVAVKLSTQQAGDISSIIGWINSASGWVKLKNIMKFWASLDQVDQGSLYKTTAAFRQGVTDITDGAVTWAEEE